MQIHPLVFKQSKKQTDKPGQLCNLLDVWNSRNKKQLKITFCSYLQNQNVILFVCFVFLHAAQVAHRVETGASLSACSIWHPCYVFLSEVGMSKMCVFFTSSQLLDKCFSISVKQLLDFTLWWTGHLSRCTAPSDHWQLGWAHRLVTQG